MSIYSKQKKKQVVKLEKLARQLYKAGYSLREVGSRMDKSHQWVKLAVDKVKSYPQ